MSGLKHVVKQRTYRERAQPAARQRLGLLEKHKDYKLRAQDYHRKQDALQRLREKAAFRNPDEFYFGMVHTKVKDGIHQKKAEAGPSGADLKRFKREDEGYLGSKHVTETRKVERLRANLHALDSMPQNRRTVFVDDDEVLEARGRAQTLAASEAPPIAPPPAAVSAKAQRARALQYKELEQREKRRDKLGKALEKIRLEKALQGKGRRKKLKVKEGEPRKFKWRQQRKR